MEELTERVSVLHRENEVLESALQAARNRGVQVKDSSLRLRTVQGALRARKGSDIGCHDNGGHRPCDR